MTSALYYKEHYYLIPKEYSDYNAFVSTLSSHKLPTEIKLDELSENAGTYGYVQKGVSFAPYFIEGSHLSGQSVIIDDLKKLYPVDVEILPQEEYNHRLREVICKFCPGCKAYKPLTSNVRSLNGHFNEISLDSICFIRYETNPSPRYFLSLLRMSGGLWSHIPPVEETKEESLHSDLKEWMYLKYDKVAFSKEEKMLLSVFYKESFITSVLTELLSDYIKSWLYFTQLRIKNEGKSTFTEEDVLKVLSGDNTEKFRKECKRYGISIGALKHNPEGQAEIESSLADCVLHNLFYPICKTENMIYYLFTDTPICLKELHFRFPMLEKMGTELTVYSQNDVRKYTINRKMPYVVM
ncbi:MAG: hypothetical protein IJX51_01990 [Clostridia bacterium]|nr:hypothetical protein [Clostridia bacterium]